LKRLQDQERVFTSSFHAHEDEVGHVGCLMVAARVKGRLPEVVGGHG